MKRTAIMFFTTLAIAVAGTAGMKVESEGRAGLDLSRYETYSWRAADNVESGAAAAEGTRLAARLEEIGDEKMKEVGFKKGAAGETDLVIRYRGIPLDMISVENIQQGDWENVSWIGDSGASAATSYRQGALLIEVLDGETDEQLWAGWAKDALEMTASREKIEAKAEKAMKKILKQFPKR